MEDKQLENAFPKSTQKRRLLLRLLALASRPMSAEELYTSMREQLSLNRSTVYRALALLTEKRLVQRTVGDDSVAYYSLPATHQHQHLLICSVCGQSVPVDGCPVEALSRKLAVDTGFQITGHRLELYGVCPQCIDHKEKGAKRLSEKSAKEG